MKKVRSTLLIIGLMFFVALAAVGCAQTGSDTMGEGSMDTHMESKSNDSMDKSMENNMQKDMMK